MTERKQIQQRGFHNLYNKDGSIWGFQFGVCTLYYKGLWLSQFRAGDCYVDGVLYPRDTLIWNIQGMDYTREELYDRVDQYWQKADVAYVKVPCPGGLAEGYHDIEIEFGWVSNYNTGGEPEYDGSGLGNAGPYIAIGQSSIQRREHAVTRRLLLVR